MEGIADYVRFFHYEPNTKLRLGNPARASYRDGYRTTAMFLAWIEKRYDKDIIVHEEFPPSTKKWWEFWK